MSQQGDENVLYLRLLLDRQRDIEQLREEVSALKIACAARDEELAERDAIIDDQAQAIQSLQDAGIAGPLEEG